MVLVIDNYDSFTYNLVQYLEELGAATRVYRNDQIGLADIDAMDPDAIVISPGPCTPREAGISVAAVRAFGPRIPILGVCLGHQSIGAAYGASVVRAPVLMHGKTSPVHHDGRGLFRGVANPFEATRYHSLVIAPETVPDCLEVAATAPDGTIMAIRHRQHPVVGVQFHPESILTREGKKILRNFLEGDL